MHFGSRQDNKFVGNYRRLEEGARGGAGSRE